MGPNKGKNVAIKVIDLE
jgi:serine/threonine-protein kinase OSR1/STK39